MNYYEPMVFYTNKLDKTFFPVVYVREDGVLERQLELLRQAGWKIIELSCEKFLKSSGSEEDAMIVLKLLSFLMRFLGFQRIGFMSILRICIGWI